MIKDKKKSLKIMILGATGFIGSNLDFTFLKNLKSKLHIILKSRLKIEILSGLNVI